MKLLVVEDEAQTARLLRKGLAEAGFVTDVCDNGLDGIELGLSGVYDAIVLDVMLPGCDGWQVVRALREQQIHTPILMLTARDAVEHRVHGLSLGADDYLIKPFAFSELLARLRAVTRRVAPISNEKPRFEDLTLDPSRQQASRAGAAIDLTAREFALLSLFLRHPGEVLSRTFISDKIWCPSSDNLRQRGRFPDEGFCSSGVGV
jgi:two-component system copper resistance phosphate regulon response regulator CusR